MSAQDDPQFTRLARRKRRATRNAKREKDVRRVDEQDLREELAEYAITILPARYQQIRG